MKIKPLFSLILCLLALLQISCSTPAKRYAATLVTIDTLNKSFVSAAQAGVLSKEQIVASKPMWAVVDKQQAIMNEELARQGTFNQAAQRSLDNVLDALQAWLVQTRARK